MELIVTYLLYALAANFCFSGSTLTFSKFTTNFSANWLNLNKAFIAAISFFITILVFSLWTKTHLESYLFWSLSGVLGLIIGDYFLMNSFSLIGPGRALMLDSFQPLLMGILAYYFLGQTLDAKKLGAIFFLLLCIFVFAHENYSQSGKWHLKGSIYALLGTSLEGISMFVARIGFDKSPEASPILGNFIRTTFAFLLLFLFARKFRSHRSEIKLTIKERLQLIVACFFGTYLSLSFYLKAIKFGDLAIISAIAISSPLFASILEIIFKKQKITKHFMVGCLCFLSGACILIFF